jgi:hypothetical protein
MRNRSIGRGKSRLAVCCGQTIPRAKAQGIEDAQAMEDTDRRWTAPAECSRNLGQAPLASFPPSGL